jgi:hypothetical protein
VPINQTSLSRTSDGINAAMFEKRPLSAGERKEAHAGSRHATDLPGAYVLVHRTGAQRHGHSRGQQRVEVCSTAARAGRAIGARLRDLRAAAQRTGAPHARAGVNGPCAPVRMEPSCGVNRSRQGSFRRHNACDE